MVGKGSLGALSSARICKRQLRCLGNTNVGTIYCNKIVGNSPELCRGLDSHEFKDLNDCIQTHTTMTSNYALDDPAAFRTGTPAQVWSTMSRCWEIAPCSERIVQDICKFQFVLEKIIEAKGCIVHDKNLRSASKYIKANNKGICKNKPRARQRKNDVVSFKIHPDAMRGRISLLVTKQINL
jgi:hypothetical protein